MIKSRIKKHILVATVVIFSIHRTQAQYFTISEHKETHPSKEVYSFPLLNSPANAEAANRINAFLQQEELDTLIVPKMKGAFVNLWPSGGVMGGTTDYQYRITANNDRFLGVEFSGEGCGAYCETYTKTYNFASSTGKHLTLKDMFTDQGLLFLDQAVRLQRVNAIKKQVARLRKELKENPKDADIAERTSEAIAMYDECLRLKRDTQYQETEYDDLYLSESDARLSTELTLVGGRCSNHAMRALDDLGALENKIRVWPIRTCLNEAAKKLFWIPETPGSRKQQLFSGTINKTIRIHLLLESNQAGSAVGGVYFYDAFSLPIPLQGRQQGNEVEFTEENEKGEQTGKFELVVANNTVSGQWIDLQRNKPLPVALTLMK